jgi:hypothetical protein
MNRTGRGHRIPDDAVVAFVAVFLAALAVSCGDAERTDPDAAPEASAAPRRATSPPRAVLPPEPEPTPVAELPPLPTGAPARVVIDAIGVDAALVELGLEDSGAMEVPDFGLAGWYAQGPPPGHPGPAVIAAHVDSRAGPDVFHRLRELAPGVEVVVHYNRGDEVVFLVGSSEQVPKDELPGARIWPLTADRLLTLITCGGEFDRDARHYRDNVIVYTQPAGH